MKFKRIISEPFVQFLMLGGLLFLLVSYVQRARDRQAREITVSSDLVNLMVIKFKTQTGMLPSKQQLDALIDHYIREEISFREAKKMGLDQDDEIIRRRLSQKYEFLQTDLSEVQKPDRQELFRFYQRNPALFQQERTVSFSHVYFNTDHQDDSLTRLKAYQVLKELNNSGVRRAPEKGDRFPLQYDYTDQSRLDIIQNLGETEIVELLFQGELNTWLGPVRSGYGWHLIFISKRNNPDPIPFPEIEKEVEDKFLDSVRISENSRRFEQVRGKYIIHRPYLQSR